jgi:hypothetical protein
MGNPRTGNNGVIFLLVEGGVAVQELTSENHDSFVPIH